MENAFQIQQSCALSLANKQLLSTYTNLLRIKRPKTRRVANAVQPQRTDSRTPISANDEAGPEAMHPVNQIRLQERRCERAAAFDQRARNTFNAKLMGDGFSINAAILVRRRINYTHAKRFESGSVPGRRRFGCENPSRLIAGPFRQVRRRIEPQFAVDNNAQRRCLTQPSDTAIQAWVICQRRSDTDDDRVKFGAQHMPALSRFGVCYPLAVARRCRDTSI
jgi:hypothetical protein